MVTPTLTQHSTPRVVDLTGLPEPVAHGICVLVEALRQEHDGNTASDPISERKPIIGMFAHLGIKTLSLAEFQEARREMWANFPREFPDPSK